jgi:hypothetical protein
MKQLASGILLLIFAVYTHGQDITVNASVDTSSFLVGDWIDVNLEVTHSNDLEVYMPAFGEELLKLEVLEVGEVEKKEKRKRTTLRQRVRLIAFDSGYYVIPPFNVAYRADPASAFDSVSTKPKMIVVHTVQVDTSQAIKPIKDPLKVPITFEEIKWWVYGGIALVLLIAFLVYWFLIREKKAIPMAPLAIQPPHEWALKQLALIEAKNLWQDGQIKVYYVELSDVIRAYIEKRYRIPALEQITHDILGNLKGEGLHQATMVELELLLNLANIAKFAKGMPDPEENKASLDRARRFIESTKEQEAPQDEVI